MAFLEAVALFLFFTLKLNRTAKKKKLSRGKKSTVIFISVNYFFQANDNLTRQTDAFSVNFQFLST